MFDLKPLSKDAIPAALSKAERYRLLNEPWQAESICRDERRKCWGSHQLAEMRRNSIGFGFAWALGGPISLFIGFFDTGFGQYGWWTYRGRAAR